MSAAQLSTAGDLRRFLADTLIGIREGSVDAQTASSIAKVAGQINASIMAEVAVTLAGDRVGVKAPKSGALIIAPPSVALPAPAMVNPSPPKPAPPKSAPSTAVWKAPPNEKSWCDQCDKMVAVSEAESCTSAFCKGGTAQ